MIYRPVRTNFLTQGFGENKVDAYKKMGMQGHNGIDMACWYKEPVYHSAPWPGRVKTEVDKDGGIGVDVISLKPFEDGYHRKLRFWHLERVLVYDGQEVSMGHKIGLGDSTGLSTGHHVHLGLKRCNAKGESIDWGNGYFGAMEFELSPQFVLDVTYPKDKEAFLAYVKSRLLEMGLSIKS